MVTLRDAPSAYRVRPEARLPRFGGGRNPFPRQESPTVLPPAETAQSAGSPGGRWQHWTAWLRRWWRGDKRDLRRRGEVRAPALRRARNRQAGGVQGELLLQAVQVVRNDLVDSDVELVVQGGDAAAVGRKSIRLWERSAVAERTLDRLAARLAGIPPR